MSASRSWLAFFALVVISLAPGASRAQDTIGFAPPVIEPAPPSGIGAIAVGSAALGLAALNLATLPVCYLDVYPSAAKDGCIIGSLAIAGVGVAVGVPSLVLGLKRRARYRAWRSSHPALGVLEQVGVSAGQNAISVRYLAHF